MILVIVAFSGISCSKSDTSAKESPKKTKKMEAKAATKQATPAQAPTVKSAPPEKFHHSGMTEMGDFVVRVPEDVKMTWKRVVLSIHNIKEKKQSSVILPIGKKTKVEGTPFEIEVLYFLPNFTMGGSIITTKDNEQKNPAAKVKIYQKGSVIWTGWLFQKFPNVHPFTNVNYRIFLVKGMKG